VTPFDPAAELRRMLAAHDIGDEEWMRVAVGGPVPSGTWTTPERLLAPDAQGRPGLGLEQLADAFTREYPGVEAPVVWSTLHTGAMWVVPDLVARLLVRSGRLVRVRPDRIRLGLRLAGREPGVDALHLEDPELVVTPDDPLAGTSGVEIRDPDDLLALMVADVVAFAAPFVDAVRSRVKIGRRGLWGNVVDALAFPLAERLPADPSALAGRARVDRLMAACAGTPLDQRLVWLDFEHDGEPQTALQTTSCCLAYKWPVRPGDGPRRDSCDPQWDRYCASCPLIPADERVHRARYWLDHASDH
jgi:hypothetical protein